MPSNEESVVTKLQRIAEKASNTHDFQFTSLFHLMNEELRLGCFEQLRKNAASGIDGMTKDQYAEQLPDNPTGKPGCTAIAARRGRGMDASHDYLHQLVDRLHRMAYIPQPVMRVYIPKPGSDKMRPLGIPALEDKLVQAGLVKILQAIYEQDFIDDSYGFRPGRGCH